MTNNNGMSGGLIWNARTKKVCGIHVRTQQRQQQQHQQQRQQQQQQKQKQQYDDDATITQDAAGKNTVTASAPLLKTPRENEAAATRTAASTASSLPQSQSLPQQ